MLIGTNTFALVFALFVLLPYVGIQHQRQGLDAQLQILGSEIDQRAKTLAAYRQAKAGMAKLRQEIEHFAPRLRQFILSLELEPRPSPQAVQQMAQQAPMVPNAAPFPVEVDASCTSRNHEAWLNCKVEKEVLRQFDGYERVLTREIVRPLSALGSPPVDPAVLRAGLDSLRQAFAEKLRQQPRFWHTYQGKVGFSLELNEELAGFWQVYGSDVERKLAALNKQLAGLNEAMVHMQAEQERLRGQEQALAEHLHQIESPWGRLPVGVEAAILIFPLILVIGFAAMVALFGDTLRLRRILLDIFRGPGSEATNAAEIAVIAPLWVDPLLPEQHHWERLGLLLLPALIYLGACGLIAYVWAISDALSDIAGLNRWLVGAFYVLGLGSMVHGVHRLLRALRRQAQVPQVPGT